MLIHQMFWETARKYADQPALTDTTTGMSLNYAKLLIASYLLGSKIQKKRDSFIGIMLPPGVGGVLSVMSALFARKTCVMINYSTGVESNCRFAQEKCNFNTIITSKKLLEKLDAPKISGMVFIEDLLQSVTPMQKAIAAAKTFLPFPAWRPGISENDTAVVLFTTGSEKEPKAVELTHKNLLSNVESMQQHIHVDHKDIFMSILPFFHVFGLTTSFLLPVFRGCHMITRATPLDYDQIPQLIRTHSCSIITSTPTFLQGYLRKSNNGDFESLRLIVAGGDKLPKQLAQGFQQQHGKTVYEGYGCTETSPVISTNVPETHKPGSVGKPLPGVKVKILDLEHETPCAPGVTGKILVAGDSIMKGYLGDFEETSLRMHDGWYDTGDMGYLDEDGFLWHKGRLKRFIKIGGEMVSLVAVEEALAPLLPENVSCCAVEIPDPRKGAKVAVAITDEIDRKHIQKELSRVLPKIALPAKYYLIPEFPMSGNGKISFREVNHICQKMEMEMKKKR